MMTHRAFGKFGIKNMAANTTLSLSFTSPSPSPSPYSSSLKHKHRFVVATKRFVSCSAVPSPFLCLVANARVTTALAAVVDEETAVRDEGGEVVEQENDGVSEEEERWKQQGRATEVYVCNLPRSCDSEQLLDMFKPHGTILSVEVSRNPESGESKGSAYVTMASINSARNAVTALDGLDVGGREMRVRFSAEMNTKRRDLETLNSSPKKTLYYEAPYKLYVGNLARSAKPEDVRSLFGRFGNVASVRVLKDLKQGKSRFYAFVSYLSEKERNAAMSLDGTEFCGRRLVVREGVQKIET